VHHVGVIVAGEDAAGTAHVGGELVDVVEALVKDLAADRLVAQVADDELISRARGELMVFQIYAA
jgi:hypothetical protein